MGIYFLAAGRSSPNREKTLDRSWSVSSVCRFVNERTCARLHECFPSGAGVYAWGANRRSSDDLQNMRAGNYVVDVKNKEVIQIFRFCFWTRTKTTRLQQELFRWDEHKTSQHRRSYRHVFFLRDPVPTTRREKAYFQKAFGHDTPHWLPGQRYVPDWELRRAMERVGAQSIETFLGIAGSGRRGYRG